MDLIERDDSSISEEEVGEVLMPSQEELNNFKSLVNEWIKVDEQVKKLNIALRERKVLLKAMSGSMQRFMEKYGYDDLNTKNQGRIRHSVRKTKESVKISEVKEVLLNNKDLTAEEVFKEIFEKDRPVRESRTIRRIMPKFSTNIDL
jgi:hypothetical protein